MSAAGFPSRIKSFFTFERLFLLILLLAIVLRFVFLDLKLFHHDEAIHSWFSWRLITEGTWQYDPTYHGPVLYFLTAAMFWVFGSSDLVARILPAVFGTLIIPLIYWIYRLGYLNKSQTLVAAIFVAISPSMVYFSRFLRHDIFMLFFTLLFVAALLAYFESKKSRYAVLAAVSVALALSLKEEMPIIAIGIGLYFIFALWKKKFPLPAQWKRDLILGIFLVTAIMAVLYSAGGTHIDTLTGKNFDITTSGWYQAVDHWMAMHNEQRLGGPWFYYILFLLLYELPIFFLAAVGTIQFIFSGVTLRNPVPAIRNRIAGRRSGSGNGSSVHYLVVKSLEQIQKQKSVPQGPPDKNREFTRFCIVWMLLTMAMYAYIGEKVPWLLIPQLLPMVFVAVYRLNYLKKIIVCLGCIFLALATWHVAFVPADVSEPIVQVQNSEDLRIVMAQIDASDKVVIASESYWPLPWYYRGDIWKKKIIFYGEKKDENVLVNQKPDMVILHDSESYDSLPGYNKTTYKLSYWFSYYDNENRLPQYYFLRDGNLGSINIDVFTRNQTA